MTTPIFQSRTDYISEIIAPALGDEAPNFDMEAIAEDALEWYEARDDKGNILLNRCGFIESPEGDFWGIVAAHQVSE